MNLFPVKNILRGPEEPIACFAQWTMGPTKKRNLKLQNKGSPEVFSCDQPWIQSLMN